MHPALPMQKKVLVIDDNPGILFIMNEALSLKKYKVRLTETFTGVAAVEAFAPDIIYLDIALVGQDGREISQTLKKNKRTKHIPIIILTAYPNADMLAQEAGADDYLSKPFELEHLWKMTEKYLSERT